MSGEPYRSPRSHMSSFSGAPSLSGEDSIIAALSNNQQQSGSFGDALELLVRHFRNLERRFERQRAIVEDLRSHAVSLEEHQARLQSEMAYTQQQLEFVGVSLEREHDIVADHTEQLRLFARQTSRQQRTGDHQTREGKSLFLILGDWLYLPLVYLAKGVYTLFSPIILTAQSLSLLNSEVLNRYDERIHTRWGDARTGDLLVMLQEGQLDPSAPLGANKKKRE